MRTRHLLSALLLGSLALVPGCGQGDPDANTQDSVQEARSSLTRNTSPGVSDAAIQKVSQGNTAFAQGLYKDLVASKAGNAFFSPLSVTNALAMLWAGAKGATATELEKGLGFSGPTEDVHRALNALDLQLASRGEGEKAKDGKNFRLRIKNSMWAEKTSEFQKPFLDVLATHYGAGVRLVDFLRASEPARLTINERVAQETEGRIKDLLSKDSVNADTRLVLVNTVYFNGAWQKPFNQGATAPAPFKAPSGTVQVPTMRATGLFPFAEGSSWEAVALPYADAKLQMLVVFPKQDDGLAALEQQLDGQRVQDVAQALRSTNVALEFPKFKVEGQTESLKPVLEKLGMKSIFVSSGDLSGISTSTKLTVRDVMHKAFVEVDEKGTEAAAATAILAESTSAPAAPPRAVKVNRPFAFFLQDVPTQAVIFAGHVTNP